MNPNIDTVSKLANSVGEVLNQPPSEFGMVNEGKNWRDDEFIKDEDIENGIVPCVLKSLGC